MHCLLFALIVGLNLDAVYLSCTLGSFCVGVIHQLTKFGGRLAFCCMLFRLLFFFVLGLSGILMRASGVNCREACPLIFFFMLPEVASGLWVTLGSAVASGDRPLAYPWGYY